MAELQEIKANVEVHQTLLVVDAMTGQDAVNVAKEFDEKVGVSGVILSKMDGDTRGGAALSVKAVTGKPRSSPIWTSSIRTGWQTVFWGWAMSSR